MPNVEGTPNARMTNRSRCLFGNSDFVIVSSFVIRHSDFVISRQKESKSESMSRSMSLQKYASVFNIGLQNTFVYRWNYFLRALFGLIPLAGTVFLWAAVFKEHGGGLHGYDYGSMIYYFLLTILVSNLVVPTEDEFQIAADIREGQINSLLTKPMSYLGYRTGIFLAGRLVYTGVTIIPIALIFFYFRSYIKLPSDVATYFLSISALI